MIKSILAAISLYLIITGLAQCGNWLIYALTPGFYANSTKEAFAQPVVVANLYSASWLILVGILTLVFRSRISKIFSSDENILPVVLSNEREFGPLMLQLLAVYLIAVNSGSIIYILWGTLSANSELIFRLNIAAIAMEARLVPFLILATSALLLIKARWLYNKLNLPPKH